MRFFWLISKSLGMLFVIVNCIVFAARMNEIAVFTGNHSYLFLVLILDTAYIYWGYYVIWKPLPKR